MNALYASLLLALLPTTALAQWMVNPNQFPNCSLICDGDCALLQALSSQLPPIVDSQTLMTTCRSACASGLCECTDSCADNCTRDSDVFHFTVNPLIDHVRGGTDFLCRAACLGGCFSEQVPAVIDALVEQARIAQEEAEAQRKAMSNSSEEGEDDD